MEKIRTWKDFLGTKNAYQERLLNVKTSELAFKDPGKLRQL
jgi:hypothetical protein